MNPLKHRFYREPIYKYRPAMRAARTRTCNNCDDKTNDTNEFDPYTEKIITDKTLWFADPYTFNDPFEFHHYITPPTRDQLNDYACNIEMPSHEINRWVDDIISQSESSYLNTLKCAERAAKEFRIGVYCSNKRADNIPMWAYYGQDHRGVCFEFNPIHDSNLARSKEVKYLKPNQSRPEFKVLGTMGDNSHEKLIYSKAYDWHHEEEVRCFLMMLESRAVPFNPAALTAIIFGCEATDPTIEHYTKLLRDNGFTHTKPKKAVKDRVGYKLNIVDL